MYSYTGASGACVPSGSNLYGAGTEGAFSGLWATVPPNTTKLAFNLFQSNSFVEFWIKCATRCFSFWMSC